MASLQNPEEFLARYGIRTWDNKSVMTEDVLRILREHGDKIPENPLPPLPAEFLDGEDLIAAE